MMGGHHAASGAAAWVAIASTGPYTLGWYPLDATGILIGGMATAGTALVCDWDHRHSTVANSLPPLSNVIAVGIENASGGHRQGTHSVLGAAFFVLLAMVAGQFQLQTDWGLLSVGAGLLCMFMINIAAKALKLFPKSGFISNWVFALTMAGLVTWFAPEQWTWLPVSMLTGVVVHIVGDMITTGGVPLLWPIVIKPQSGASQRFCGSIYFSAVRTRSTTDATEGTGVSLGSTQPNMMILPLATANTAGSKLLRVNSTPKPPILVFINSLSSSG